MKVPLTDQCSVQYLLVCSLVVHTYERIMNDDLEAMMNDEWDGAGGLLHPSPLRRGMMSGKEQVQFMVEPINLRGGCDE